MGRSRWRNMAKNNGPGSHGASVRGGMPTESIVVACPGGERPGFDAEVFSALYHVNALIEDMRTDIHVSPAIIDADTAVRRYLVYLSMLIDVMFADTVMSVVHSTDLAVRIQRRMLLEYCAKGLYCFDHPEYCLDFTTTLESKSVLGKLNDGGQPEADIKVETTHLQSQLDRFPPKYLKSLEFSAIMRHYTRPPDSETNDEYVGLYRLPSAYIHGDPEGMRFLMPPNEQGHAAPTITVGDDELDAMMVDVGANTLVFCRVFIATFKPNDESIARRQSDLELAFDVLGLKHAYGRPAEAIEALKRDVDAARAEGRIR
jgi:hypothetical protein